MAELLPPGTDLRAQPRRARTSCYPSQEWADGRARRLRLGEDSGADDIEKLRRTVHAYAKAHGLRSATHMVDGDEEALDIQFFGKP